MALKKAQEAFNKLVKELKDGTFKYEPREEKEIDWAAYNLSKIHETELFLNFIREAVDAAEIELSKQKGPGRPAKDAYDLTKVLLMQTYFHVANRQAAGFAILFREKLMLKEFFSESTVGRAYSNPDVQKILNKVFELTNKPIEEKETAFSADGTGLPLSNKQNYANDRDDQKKHADYGKMAVMISNSFHIATAFVYAKGSANDCPLFEPLIGQTAMRFQNIEDVELDAGFIARYNCNLIASYGATPYIYPKTGLTLNRKGSGAWTKMWLSLVDDPQKWMRRYHQRSQNECYFSSHKRRHTRPLLKRKGVRRETEAQCRVIVTNICMLITAAFERRVDVPMFGQDYL